MRFFKQYLSPFLFFSIISSIIIFSWFRFGHMYGGGEVGLPTYNPSRLYESAKYIWWDIIAPGFVAPQSVTSVPFLFFLTILQKVGFSPLWLQILWFYLLLFLMGFGMYLFTLSLFNKEKRNYAIIAALFYMFNPYMMIQIWHRFVYSPIFFVTALPYLAITWRAWIKKGNFLSLALFIFINFLAVYSYGTTAFIITLWLFLSLISGIEVFIPWSGRNYFLKFSFRFGLGLIFWLLVNTWWIVPFLAIGPGWISQQHGGIGENLFTVINISKQTILPYVLQLINPFHLYYNSELGDIYNSLFFRVIPWIGTAVIFIGFLFGLRKKELPTWSISFLIIILLSKGAATPFGFIYQWGFSHFFLLGIIRNSFEKIGILLPFVSSILLIVGIQVILNFSSKLFNRSISHVILIIILSAVFIHSWPMFFSKVFGTYNNPNFVEVPEDYKLADEYIKTENHARTALKKDGKILHLPLTREEAVTYKWKFGYRGVEIGALLFNSLPSISHGFTLGRIDDSLTALSLIFNKDDNIDKDKILKILQAFNVEFIVLHKDIDWHGGDVYDPTQAEKIIDKLDFLGNKQVFGDLTVYELAEKYYEPKIILSNNFQVIYPSNQMGIWPWLKNEKANFISPGDSGNVDSNLFSNGLMIFPESAFSYNRYSDSDIGSLFNNFSNTLSNPNAILGQLSKIKDNLKTTGEIQASHFLNQLIFSTKELFAINQKAEIHEALSRYENYIKDIFEKQAGLTRLSLYINSSIVSDIFQMHLIKLMQLQNSLMANDNEYVSQILTKLKQYLATANLLATYTQSSNFSIQRGVNRFQIPKNSTYELLMTDSKSVDLYNPQTIDFQINDKLTHLEGNKKGDFTSFGDIDLGIGSKEIIYDNITSANLFPQFDKLTKQGIVELMNNSFRLSSSKRGVSIVEADFPVSFGGSIYQISFEYQVTSGEGFRVQLLQDTDSLTQENISSPTNLFIPHPQENTVQRYSFSTPPLKPNTRVAKLRFLVFPSSDTITGSATTILINSPKIVRVLNNQIFLQNHPSKIVNNIAGQIMEINQKNPTLYTGKVKILTPSFIFLKESFHPGWKLTLSNSKDKYTPTAHYLGNLYGNAWFVDKTGDFDFKVELEPQAKSSQGLFLASLGGSTLFILLIVTFIKSSKHEKN